jgi:hypothetical protein
MPQLLFYDPAAGRGMFYGYDEYGAITPTPLKTYTDWRSSWKQIIPGFFGSFQKCLLFYDGAGTGEFYTVDEQAEIALLKTHTGWVGGGVPWTHIIAGKFVRTTAYTSLLFYDSAGTGAFYTTYDEGEIDEVRRYTGWVGGGVPWTHIIPIKVPLRTHLLFYDSAGTGAFYETDGQGGITELRRHTGWVGSGVPWTHIIPIVTPLIERDGAPPEWRWSLLFYDSAGTAAFYRYDEHGGITELRRHTDWFSSWKQIITVWTVSGHRQLFPGLLFYDGAGTGEFYSYDGLGGITLLRTNTDLPSGCRILEVHPPDVPYP